MEEIAALKRDDYYNSVSYSKRKIRIESWLKRLLLDFRYDSYAKIEWQTSQKPGHPFFFSFLFFWQSLCGAYTKYIPDPTWSPSAFLGISTHVWYELGMFKLHNKYRLLLILPCFVFSLFLCIVVRQEFPLWIRNWTAGENTATIDKFSSLLFFIIKYLFVNGPTKNISKIYFQIFISFFNTQGFCAFFFTFN